MTSVNFDRLADGIIDRISMVAEGVTDVASDAASGIGRLKEFNSVGRDLAASGAVTSHGGNMSISDGNKIWITRTGSQLGHIGASDIIQVDWQPSNADKDASMELVVHRAMYHAWAEHQRAIEQPFSGAAIVHTHGLHTTFHSLTKDTLVPVDSEGLFVLGQFVAVLDVQQTIASEEVAELMAGVIEHGDKVAIVRGHGPFALAGTLADAHRLVSCLEYSASMLTLVERRG